MPIYEYRCQECDARFDKFVRSMSAEADVTCPTCGGNQVQRGFSTFASLGDQSRASGASASNCAPTG